MESYVDSAKEHGKSAYEEIRLAITETPKLDFMTKSIMNSAVRLSVFLLMKFVSD